MARSMFGLVVVAAAGLVLAACGEADDTAGEVSTTSVSTETTSSATAVAETQGDDADGAGDAAGDDADTMDDDMETADGDMETAGGDMDMDDDMDMDMSGAYGEPADASDADRTIEVVVDNEFAFQPAEHEVAAGEVVTFRITNTGDLEHEFVLGDEQAQQQMGEQMDEGDDGHAHSGEMSNAVTVHAGEEAELTWRFPDDAVTVLIGCHVPGHWEAGMRGSVTVG